MWHSIQADAIRHRIMNGTFEIDGQTSHIPNNEHGGLNPLHGGFVGYDQQNWTIASQTGNSITFVFYDQAQQGFPGDLLNVATYTLTDEPAWISRMVSIPLNEATPVMLANHVYWNLGAFVNKEAITVLNDTLYMPYADRIIEVDSILIPTGQINMTNGTAFDFTHGKQIGSDIFQPLSQGGLNGSSYDNAFILDRPRYAMEDPALEVLRLSSPSTGIQMSADQPAGSPDLHLWWPERHDCGQGRPAAYGQHYVRGAVRVYCDRDSGRKYMLALRRCGREDKMC